MADTPRLGSKRLTLREFLEWEERQQRKYELIDGLVRMMAGGTRAHNTVKGNIFAALRGKLRGGPCRPFDSDMKVLTARAQSFYPDVTVDCGEAPDASTRAERPTIIFEVFSPATRQSDLEEKLPAYQETPSIRQIIFLEAERQHVMVWRRTESGWAEDEVVHPEDALLLDPIGVSLTMREIYEDVAFDG